MWKSGVSGEFRYLACATFSRARPPKAMTRPDRSAIGKHHAVAEAIVRNRNILAVDQQARFDHGLEARSLAGQMIAQRESPAGGEAEAELALHRGRYAALGEIGPSPAAGPACQLGLEKGGGRLDDFMERSALLLVRLRLRIGFRQGKSGLAGEPLDRFGKTQTLGRHDEIENVAVAARGKIEPGHFLVVDEKGRRLFRAERRERLSFACPIS